MQFHIDNMICGSCIRHIVKAITGLDPSAVVEADTVARQISPITRAAPDAVIKALAEDGYAAGLR